jgi:hypothetical protein
MTYSDVHNVWPLINDGLSALDSHRSVLVLADS